MSHTDHYADVTIEQIVDMFTKLGRNPRIVDEHTDGSSKMLYWDIDKVKDKSYLFPDRNYDINPWGVDFSFDKGNELKHTNDVLHIDKGCCTCWNGQSLLSDLIKEHLGEDVLYCD